MEYNVYQKNVIYSNEPNILCLAPAASGKTRVLVARIQRLLDDGIPPSSIVAFTFTNQAGEEMRSRLGHDAEGMFIGTIHSYANRICSLNGVDTRGNIVRLEFDDLLRKALKINQKNYPKIDFLFVDELQDIDRLQYQFVEKIPTKNRFYVGDDRQVIYQFRYITGKIIMEIAERPDFKTYPLVYNYRNAPNILAFANDFLNSTVCASPVSVPVIQEDGYLDEACTFNEAVEEITWDKNWKEWAILCRCNAEIAEAERRLNNLGIPNIIIQGKDVDLEETKELFNLPKVKIMSCHVAKGCEFPRVIAVGMQRYNEAERKISYVAATRAIKALYWCPSIVKNRKNPYKTKKLRERSIFDNEDAGGMVSF